MQEIRIIKENNGIEVFEQSGDRKRGVLLTEGTDTLDFHLAQNTIKIFSEMIIRHQRLGGTKSAG